MQGLICVWITVSVCVRFCRRFEVKNPEMRISDENRGYLLEAGFPQAVLPILDAYTKPVVLSYPIRALQLSTLHLDIVKTMVGALLNCSLDYGR